MRAFKNNHFGRKKVVKIVFDNSSDSLQDDSSDKGLTVVKEHTFEETKSSGKVQRKRPHIGAIKKSEFIKKSLTSMESSVSRSREINYFAGSSNRRDSEGRESIASYFTLVKH